MLVNTYRGLAALSLLTVSLTFVGCPRRGGGIRPRPKAHRRPIVPTDLTVFRGNPERNLSAVGTVPRRPKLLWRFQTQTKYEGPYERRGAPKLRVSTPWRGLGWTGQPVRLAKRIYFGSTDSYVHCLDATTGKEIWYYPNHHCIKGSIMISGDHIYHGGRDNKLHCYTLDGKPARGRGEGRPGMVWETRTGNDMDSSPAIVKGRGYVGAEDKHILCFDPRTGEILWKFGPTNGSVESSPCVFDGKVMAGSDYGSLFCLDAKNGKPIWTFNTLGDTDSTPVHVNGRIYVGSKTKSARERGWLWCIDAEKGTQIWKVDMPRGIWATPAVSAKKNRVYIGCNNGLFYCFAADSGKLIWKRFLGSRIWSSAAITDDCVVVGVRNGTLWCLNEDDGKPLWVFDDGFDIDATPCVARGMIVIGSQNGWIYGIGEAPKNEPLNRHWFRSAPFTKRTDHDSTGIVTIKTSAPEPKSWRDTNAGCRDHLYQPVRAVGRGFDAPAAGPPSPAAR